MSALIYIKNLNFDISLLSVYCVLNVYDRNVCILGLKPCCQASRHSLHQHFQYLQRADIERNEMPELHTMSYIELRNDETRKIIEIMDEERRSLGDVNGGKATLDECISMEIYGKENVDLPIRYVVAEYSSIYSFVKHICL
jgi:hypothetical protein